MLSSFKARLWDLRSRLGPHLCRRRRGSGGRCGSRCRRGRGCDRVVDQLGYPGLDGLVSRELGLGVELEIAPRPVERADNGVVA